MDDDEEIDETKPPEQVPQDIFDKVLNLRARKREKDERLLKIQDKAEELRLKAEPLRQKEGATQTAIHTANRELTGFRANK